MLSIYDTNVQSNSWTMDTEAHKLNLTLVVKWATLYLATPSHGHGISCELPGILVKDHLDKALK